MDGDTKFIYLIHKYEGIYSNKAKTYGNRNSKKLHAGHGNPNIGAMC